MRADNIHIVFFDRVPVTDLVNKVVADNFGGAYDGTKYLISKGKRRIAHITSPPVLSITRERMEGYKSCLSDHGIKIDEDLIKFCGFNDTQAYETIEKIVEECQPDSFIIGSDRLAMNSLEALKRIKNKLPPDMEIVGFTNMKYANLLDPVIHNISQPAFEMGQQAANLLIDNIEAKHIKPEVKKIVFKTELIIR